MRKPCGKSNNQETALGIPRDSHRDPWGFLLFPKRDPRDVSSDCSFSFALFKAFSGNGTAPYNGCKQCRTV